MPDAPESRHLISVGLSHHTAPVALRERLAFDPERRIEVLGALRRALPGADTELALLSTCNRTEVYAVGPAGMAHEALAEAVEAFLVAAAGGPAEALAGALVRHADGDAARHLLRVAAGLESMVIGEAQILGQVREAARLTRAHGTGGPTIEALFAAAVRAGRRARCETGIHGGAACVPTVAVALARAEGGALDARHVLVVGAGKMGVQTARALLREGVGGVSVCSRSTDHARALADRWGGRVVPFGGLAGALAEADLVITSTGAPAPIVKAHDVRAAMAGRDAALTIIDIAVPRDVEAAAGEVPGVALHDIDAISAVVQDNLGERRAAVPAVLAIVEDEAARFGRWRASRRVSPTIAELRRWADGVRDREVARALGQLEQLDDAERDVVRALSESLVGKLLHPALARLHADAEGPDGPRRAAEVRTLFDLPEPPGGPGAP